MQKIKNYIKKNWYFIVIFLIFFVLNIFFPFSGDDYAWGSKIGIERLKTFFQDYNGRYAGNLLVLLITRSKVLRATIESIFFSLIIININKIINRKNSIFALLAIFLLLLMPIEILRESVVWASGFSNYVPPICLVLIYIHKNNYLFEDKKLINNHKFIDFICYLVIGFVGALFIENITIYITILSIFVVIYEYIKRRKVSIHNIAYLIGAFGGLITMFTNGAYHLVSQGVDSYRTVENGNIITNSFIRYRELFNKYIFYNNFFITILIAILCLLIINRIIKARKKELKTTIAYLCIISLIMYIVNCVFLKFYTVLFTRTLFNELLNTFLTFLFALSVLFIALYAIKNKASKKRVVLYLISLIIINAPLLIVNPVGPRLFFGNYVFLLLIALELINDIGFYKNNELKDYLVICNTTIMTFFLIIFLQVAHIELVTKDYIKKHKNEENLIVLPELPFEKYIHAVNPNSESVFNYRYKIYYGINENCELQFENYKEWKKTHK